LHSFLLVSEVQHELDYIVAERIAHDLKGFFVADVLEYFGPQEGSLMCVLGLESLLDEHRTLFASGELSKVTLELEEVCLFLVHLDASLVLNAADLLLLLLLLRRRGLVGPLRVLRRLSLGRAVGVLVGLLFGLGGGRFGGGAGVGRQGRGAVVRGREVGGRVRARLGLELGGQQRRLVLRTGLERGGQTRGRHVIRLGVLLILPAKLNVIVVLETRRELLDLCELVI